MRRITPQQVKPEITRPDLWLPENAAVRYTAEIFELLRWVGAAYLVWLGIQAWRHAGAAGAAIALPRDHVHFRRGLLAALSDAGWAIAAGAGRTFFLRCANAKWLGRVSGLALIGGGVWLSLARRPG